MFAAIVFQAGAEEPTDIDEIKAAEEQIPTTVTTAAAINSYVRCFPDSDKSSNRWRCIEVSASDSTVMSRDPSQLPLSPLDWVPSAFLSPEQQEALPPGCQGNYVDPLQGTAESDLPLDEIDLVIEADDSSLTQGNTAILEGNVQVSHGNRSISAEKMSYDRRLEEALLEGGVTIRNPGLLIRGDRATASTTRNEATFERALFVLHKQHMRGSAESVIQNSDKVIILKNGSVTACEPGSRAWMLEGGEIKIDNEVHQGTGKNLKLRIGNVPVAYIPYISFPLGDARKSGILFPSISSSDDGGLDVALPYYWNLAPNYDATITPRLISGRGPMLETEARHMNSWLQSSLNIAYLADDEGGQDKDIEKLIADGVLDEAQAKPHRGNNRWLAGFQQTGGSTRYFGWYSDALYTKVSDVDYFRDLGTSSFNSINTSYLQQYYELGYLLPNWQFNGRVQNSQVLLLDVDTPYQLLPKINANGNYNFGNYGLKLNNEYANFEHTDQFRINGSRIITGQRFATDYRLNWTARYPWGFIVPEMGYKSLAYQLDEQVLSDPDLATPQLMAGQASLDTGLVFERNGGRFLQTIEPRVYFLYREREDHSGLFNVTDDGQYVNFDTSIRTFSFAQLFRDSRFSGKDRLDDANQGTIGISHRWIDNSDGHELFRASVGQVFLEDDQRVSLTNAPSGDQRSEIAGELSAYLGPLGRFYTAAIFDSETDQINRASASVNFANEEFNTLVNLSYSYVRNFQQIAAETKNIDQLDASAVVPLSRQWAIMARQNYDFNLEQELETFLGLEYNDCCYRIRLLARKWLDSNVATLVQDDDLKYDQGIFFEIHFKGLGGSGAKVDSILSDSIMGYDDRERLNFQHYN